MSKEFSLGDVLSVTTGRLLSNMDGLYDILNYMTGDNLFTHQLVRATQVCEPVLLNQYPDLAKVVVPEDFGGDKDAVAQWLAQQEQTYGSTLAVEPLESWERKDPINELVEMRGGPEGIVVVTTEETESK